MKKSWAPALILAAAAVIGGAAMAQENSAPAEATQTEAAEEQTVTAMVESIDADEGTITTTSGGEFKTPEGWRNGMVRKGSIVRITYTAQGEERIASRIRLQQ